MTIAPADLLAYVGGAALERYGRLWRVTRPADRGGEEGAPAFTRATVGVYIDRDGVLRNAASGVPRVTWLDLDGDGVREPYLLSEPTRTQLITSPEDFSAWGVIGTPSRTSGQADPRGGTGAYLLEADAVDEGVIHSADFTGDGEKVVSLRLRAGTAAVSRVQVWDATAGGGTDRHSVSVTWATLAVATIAGTGTNYVLKPLGGGWYRLAFSVAGVVADNDNQLRIFAAGGGATGTVYIYGANAWDASVPSSYQGPSLATRNADLISLPLGVGTRARLSLYWRGAITGSNGTDDRWLVQVGTNSANRLGLRAGGSPQVAGYLQGATSTVTVTGNAQAFAPETVQELILQYDAGVLRLYDRTTLLDTDTCDVLTGGWSEQQLHVGHADGVEHGVAAHHAVMLASGLHDVVAFREWLP